MWMKTDIDCDWPLVAVELPRRTERASKAFFDFLQKDKPQQIGEKLEAFLGQIENEKYKHCVVIGLYRPPDKDAWVFHVMHPTFPRTGQGYILPSYTLTYSRDD